MIVPAAHFSVLFLGIVAAVLVLDFAKIILAPIFLGVVIGLMFGPLADIIERLRIPPWIAGAAVVLLFIALLAVAIAGFAVPLSQWVDRLPVIWSRIEAELISWKGMVASMEALQEQVREAMGRSQANSVNVKDGSAVESAVENVAYLAPAILAQIVVFLASLYFFIATRHRFRVAVLSVCLDRGLRRRVSRIFRDIEHSVSRYLLSITGVNVALGLAVSAALWALDVPSPLLWGMLAGVLNYIVYIGPAVMAAILLAVGLGTANDAMGILMPAMVFLGLNLIEAQFVTPQVLGHTMTLNPFIVFLTLTFWIWIWGPVGGFVAIPSLLILDAVIRTILPVPAARPGS